MVAQITASETAETSRPALYVKPKINPRTVVMRDAAGRILYAVVGLYGTIQNPRYEGPSYFSASDQASAEFQFKKRFWHLHFAEVWAGPAIGFFVHDNHGDVLSSGGSRPEARTGKIGERDEG